MAIFVQVQDLSGRLVWVNPAQINYMHVVGEKTVLYFDKDRSIELGEPIETFFPGVGPGLRSAFLSRTDMRAIQCNRVPINAQTQTWSSPVDDEPQYDLLTGRAVQKRTS